MPDDPMGRERVFDIPDEPPVRPAAPPRAPAPSSSLPDAPAASGDSAIWPRLLDQYKGRLPVNHRVFLNMAGGVLDNGCLTVYCNNDFVTDSLNNTTVLSVLQEVTSAAAGQSIRVELKVGSAPKSAAAPVRTAPTPPPATRRPEPGPEAAPAQTPPWEEASTVKTQDRLDELVAPAQKLDHFKIK